MQVSDTLSTHISPKYYRTSFFEEFLKFLKFDVMIGINCETEKLVHAQFYSFFFFLTYF